MTSVLTSSKQSRRHFEIVLDSPFVVICGDAQEAEPVGISGKLVLDTADYVNVKSIKVKIQGRRRVSWTSHGSALNGTSHTTQVIRAKNQLLDEERQFLPTAGATTSLHRIASGHHEWRFEFKLDPRLPESIEGLHGNYIVYDLCAEIDRGYMSKSLVATKHLRLIRTLSRDMTETVPFPYSNEDTWADKIKYHIYIPSRYFAFGTSIPVQFTLIPLRKGIKIGKIKMEVIERVALEAYLDSNDFRATTLSDKTVARIDQPQVPTESTCRLVEESSGIADESYHFKINLPLPRSLNQCRQSVSTDSIKVFHNLKIYVNIHNPDGHTSQLCLRNVVHLYISPHTQINDDQTMEMSTEARARSTLNAQVDAPPTYGTHLLDQLYDDIDLAGFNSGCATPVNLLSRNQSLENLALRFSGLTSPSSPAESEGSRTPAMTEPHATQLHSRLNALDMYGGANSAIARGNRSSADSHSGRSSLRAGMSSLRHSIALPRRWQHSDTSPDSSGGEGSHDERQSPVRSPRNTQHGPALAHGTIGAQSQGMAGPAAPTQELDGYDLSRTPSYNTAISLPYRPHHPGSDDRTTGRLPTYEDATSVANSPEPTPP